MLKNLLSMSSLNLFKAAVQFGVSTMVALYVAPSEYGLVTFSLPIIQFIALFTDMGLASALIRQPKLSAEDAGGAMSFSLVVGIVAAGLLAASAYPIEWWSGLRGLGAVLAALSGAVFLAIAAGVPRALMERRLRYEAVALIEGGATLIAATFSILSTMLGAGIWALIAFQIALQAARALGFFVIAQGHMRMHLKWRSVAKLLSFGSWVLATNLVNFFGRNAQNLLIGAWQGAAAVGLYGLAYQFMILPLMALAWPAGGVLMATLSRMAESAPGGQSTLSRGRFATPVLAISALTAAIAFPLMIFVGYGLVLPIHKLLSAHWAPVAPLLATLAPLGAIQALASYNGAVLIARGNARLQFYVNAISTVILLAGFVSALPFGLTAFAWTYLVLGMVVAAGQIAAKLWASNAGWRDYGYALFPAIGATALGCTAAALVGHSPDNWIKWAEMTIAYAVGVLVGLALLRNRLLGALRHLLGSEQSQQTLVMATADQESLQAPGSGTAPTVA